jgi:uncharacterized phage-associated protein
MSQENTIPQDDPGAWLKKYKAPKTDEEIENEIKEFGPYCQVAYKAAVLHHMFGIDWENAKAEAKRFGEDSDDEFFDHINMLNSVMGLVEPKNA